MTRRRTRLAAFALLAVLGLAGTEAWAGKLEDAQTAFADSDDATALKLLNEVIAESKDDPKTMGTAYFNRGEVLVSYRETDRALADFTAALALQTDATERALTLVARAETYNRKQMQAEALADYSESLKLAPGQTGVLTARAGLHLRMGNRDAALADYDAELKLRPRYGRALTGRAQLLGLPIPTDEELGRR